MSENTFVNPAVEKYFGAGSYTPMEIWNAWSDREEVPVLIELLERLTTPPTPGDPPPESP